LEAEARLPLPMLDAIQRAADLLEARAGRVR